MTALDKQGKLNRITKEIEECNECRKNGVGKPVPGEGNADADIVFIGEAPGRVESQTGRPFVGRSGQLLRALIRDTGLHEKNVYITSPVKYLPSYKTPKPKDIAHGKVHLQDQLGVIDPKFLVLLGNTAIRAMLPWEKIAILKDHGKVFECEGYQCLVTIHPAAALRFPKYKKILESDFKKISTF